MDQIPSLDISALLTQPLSDTALDALSIELRNKLKKFGVINLINHGIPQELMSKAFEASKKVFIEDKEYLRSQSVIGKGKNIRLGWVDDSNEVLNNTNTEKNRKMAWDYTLNSAELQMIPIEKRAVLEKLWDENMNLSSIFMGLIAKAIHMNVEDFKDIHKNSGNQLHNSTVSRILYYPSIQPSAVNNESLRIAPHTDYGSFSFLFQDDTGGLQVLTPENGYIDVIPRPGAIIVLVADMLEIISNGTFKAAYHRVIPSTIPGMIGKERQSFGFFQHPDLDRKFTYEKNGIINTITGRERINEQYQKSFREDNK